MKNETVKTGMKIGATVGGVPGHRRLYIRTDRVVVEKWGQMRALQGRAYLPAMIPPGVSLEEIK